MKYLTEEWEINNISHAIRKNRMANGFFWKYKNERLKRA